MDPFIKRSNYNHNATLDKEDFTYLLSRLSQIGFKSQVILLPTFIIDNRNKGIKSGPEENVLTVQDYLEGDIDYDAILLKTTTEDQLEEILVLFKQYTNKSLAFNETKFQVVSENARPSFYISTFDPVKTFGLNAYLKDYFKSKVHYATIIYWGISLTIILFGLLYILIKNPFAVTVTVAILIAAILFIVFTIIFLPKTGLKISSRKKMTYPSYITELRKNWLVIVVAFLLGLLANYLVKIF